MKTIDMDTKPRKAVIDSPLSEILCGDSNGFGDIIKCPICNFDYSHIQEIKILNSDEYKAWPGRGSCIVIPFEGECGHAWNICIGFHKGQNFAFIDVVRRAARL